MGGARGGVMWEGVKLKVWDGDKDTKLQYRAGYVFAGILIFHTTG